MRYIIWVTVLLVCISSSAQSPSNAPQFEVASIRPVVRDASVNERDSQVLRGLIRDLRKPGEILLASPDRIRLKDWNMETMMKRMDARREPSGNPGSLRRDNALGHHG